MRIVAYTPLMLKISERILLTLWVGGMWSVGYIVAPTLFKMLDRSVAGTVAGQLFTIMSYLGLVCAVLLLINQFFRYGKAVTKHWQSWALGIMLLIVIIGEFFIAPEIRSMRDAGLVDSEKARFGMLHGSASVLFLISSLLGLALVIFGLHKKENT